MPLDAFDGQCWIGIVPFSISHVRPRWVPAAGGLRFPELNVRTYVTLDNKPGVYFLSLDTAYQSVVWAARTFYHLPYWQAQMQVGMSEDKVTYSSRRNLGAAQLSAFYRPAAPLVACQPGSLEHWLTERYCFYTRHRGRIYRGEVHHGAWPLQNAEAEFGKNTMATAAGIALPGCAPLLDFSRRNQVLIWPLAQLP